ncbi:MAG: hypothetical protein CVU65_13340 [Deltaproteobacteria bacterium HGW-Deltaproteobacteria-22]|jgi:hypothetical protein|nr:MAG: hypothetical protein CVU65_13340 [Deltaproteobacteria bacterium HGW-Deltaproteobacteria-22]
MRLSRTAFSVGALVLATLLGSCSFNSRPVKVYREFTYAWGNHNGRGVHAVVAPALRRTSTPAYWRMTSREPGRKAVGLPSGLIKLQWSATVPVVFSTQIWKYTRNGWRLVSTPFPHYGQETPDRAVVSFTRALEFERFDILAQLLPDELRLAISPEELKKMFNKKRPEIAELLAKLKKAEGTPVLVSGSTAVFPYDTNRRLRLIKQDQGWCIADPD